MGRVTADMAVSLDLVGAGRDQSFEHPFGPAVGDRLHTWMLEHADDHQDEIDAITTAGAYVMGRHMFGPDRGDWDLSWTGWWGPEPPYHAPVFVLGRNERGPVELAGARRSTSSPAGSRRPSPEPPRRPVAARCRSRVA